MLAFTNAGTVVFQPRPTTRPNRSGYIFDGPAKAGDVLCFADRWARHRPQTGRDTRQSPLAARTLCNAVTGDGRGFNRALAERPESAPIRSEACWPHRSSRAKYGAPVGGVAGALSPQQRPPGARRHLSFRPVLQFLGVSHLRTSMKPSVARFWLASRTRRSSASHARYTAHCASAGTAWRRPVPGLWRLWRSRNIDKPIRCPGRTSHPLSTLRQ